MTWGQAVPLITLVLTLAYGVDLWVHRRAEKEGELDHVTVGKPSLQTQMDTLKKDVDKLDDKAHRIANDQHGQTVKLAVLEQRVTEIERQVHADD